MDYLISNLLATVPTGMWEKIIMVFESAFTSFALAIIVLTIVIKLVMSPLDYFNRRINKKNASMQAKMQPQMAAIQKKYANDKNMQNQKLAELYKKEKFSPIGSCFIMLINLALTMTIFFTLFSGLNTMSAYKITDQYEQLQIAYVQDYVLDTYGTEIDLTQEKSIYEICLPYVQEMNAIADETAKKAVITKANESVEKRYKEVREGFLWIDNIWLADSPFKNSIPNFSSYATTAKLNAEQQKDENLKAYYEQIMNPLSQTSGRANGYFILVIICTGTAFLNQWLLTRKSKKDKTQTPAQASGKAMLIVMPVVMGLFTLFYTTMFSLYIITSQVVSIATTPVLNAIGNAIDNKKSKKQEPTNRMKRI